MAALGSTVLRRADGVEFDIGGEWQLKTVHGAVSEALGEVVTPDTSEEQLRRLCLQAGLPAEPGPEGPIVAAYTTYATYTVQPGDTLNKVATQFGVSGDRIMRTSGLADPNLLLPGQVLSIPRDSGWLYRVQPGDTPDTIALRFGVSIEDLMTASGGAAAALRPGDLVFVPDRGTPAPKR